MSRSLGRSVVTALLAVAGVGAGSWSPASAADEPPLAWSTGANRGVLRHPEPVVAVAFGPGGSSLVSASADGIRVWDLATGTVSRTLEGSAGDWRTLVVTPGEIVTLAGDGGVARWVRETGAPAGALPDVGRDASVLTALSGDGAVLATTTADQEIELWEATTGTPIAELDTMVALDAPVTQLAISDDGSMVAATVDGVVHVLDAANGGELAGTGGGTPGADPAWIAFDAAGRLATGGSDDAITVWDVGTGEAVATIEGDSDDVLAFGRGGALGADGALAARVGVHGDVLVTETATGLPLATPDGHTAAIRSVAFSPDGTHVLTGDETGAIRTWDAVTGTPEIVASNGGARVVNAVWSADGSLFATDGAGDSALVWGARSGSTVATIELDSALITLGFAPDASTLVTTDGDGRAQLWDALTGAELATLDGADGVWAVYSDDGSLLADHTAYDTIAVWGAATGALRAELPAVGQALFRPTFDADGSLVAAAGVDDTVFVWDIASGQQVQVQALAGGRGVGPVAFLPDGSLMAGDAVWDVATGARLYALDRSVPAVSELDAAMTLLAVGFDDGTVELFDAATGQLLFTFAASDRGIRDLAFDPAGSLLVTAGDDGVARAWTL